MTLYLTKTEQQQSLLYAAVQQFALPPALSAVCTVLGIRSNAAANFLFYCINFACWVAILKRPLVESFRKTDRLLPAMGRGFAIHYLGGMVVQMVLRLIEPEYFNVNDANIGQMIREFPPLVIGVVFLAPVAEECMFRGLLFAPFLQKRPWVGYVVSCLCFSVVHLTAYFGTVDGTTLFLSFLQYLPAGAALCYACKEADSLAAPILMHTCINALSVVLSR